MTLQITLKVSERQRLVHCAVIRSSRSRMMTWRTFLRVEKLHWPYRNQTKMYVKTSQAEVHLSSLCVYFFEVQFSLNWFSCGYSDHPKEFDVPITAKWAKTCNMWVKPKQHVDHFVNGEKHLTFRNREAHSILQMEPVWWLVLLWQTSKQALIHSI